MRTTHVRLCGIHLIHNLACLCTAVLAPLPDLLAGIVDCLVRLLGGLLPHLMNLQLGRTAAGVWALRQAALSELEEQHICKGLSRPAFVNPPRLDKRKTAANLAGQVFPLMTLKYGLLLNCRA